MERRVTPRLAARAAAAAVVLALGIVLALTAADVLSWRGQTARASVALDRRSYKPGIWEPQTVLPVALSRWLVAADDEVAFGRGVQRFRMLRSISSTAGASSSGAFQASQVRIAQTELALERLAQRPLPPKLRSRAQQLAAIALFEHLISGTNSLSSQVAPLDQTSQALARAIRTDTTNDAAKIDLEQLYQLYARVLNVEPEELRLHPNKASSKSRGGSPGVLFGGGGY
jgi:hypothetical protein